MLMIEVNEFDSENLTAYSPEAWAEVMADNDTIQARVIRVTENNDRGIEFSVVTEFRAR